MYLILGELGWDGEIFVNVILIELFQTWDFLNIFHLYNRMLRKSHFPISTIYPWKLEEAGDHLCLSSV